MHAGSRLWNPDFGIKYILLCLLAKHRIRKFDFDYEKSKFGMRDQIQILKFKNAIISGQTPDWCELLTYASGRTDQTDLKNLHKYRNRIEPLCSWYLTRLKLYSSYWWSNGNFSISMGKSFKYLWRIQGQKHKTCKLRNSQKQVRLEIKWHGTQI